MTPSCTFADVLRPLPKTHRLPAEIYADTSLTFHVVIRAFPGTAPFRGAVGQRVWNCLLGNQRTGLVDLTAACLMPDHLHLILSPRTRSVPGWVGSFKSHTTRESWGAGHTGRLWQPSFFDRAIRNESEFNSTVDYVMRNPFAAGLVSEGESWSWAFGRGDTSTAAPME